MSPPPSRWPTRRAGLEGVASQLPVDGAELLRRRRRGGGRRGRCGRRSRAGCCRSPSRPVYLTFRSYRDLRRPDRRPRSGTTRKWCACTARRLRRSRPPSRNSATRWPRPARTTASGTGTPGRRALLLGALEADDRPVGRRQRRRRSSTGCSYVARRRRHRAAQAHSTPPRRRAPHFEHEYRVRHVDGEIRWMLCRGIAVRDEAGRPVRMAGSQTDITERRRIQDTLAHAARHDALTELPNRTLFSELLAARDRAGRAARRRPATPCCSSTSTASSWSTTASATSSATSSWWHRAAAARAAAARRRAGAPGRRRVRRAARGHRDARRRAARSPSGCSARWPSRSSIGGREVLRVRQHRHRRSAAPQYQRWTTLLRDADTAMYRAKAAGRGGYELFDPAMHAVGAAAADARDRAAARDRAQRVHGLLPADRRARPRREICGFEALVRWERPDGHDDAAGRVHPGRGRDRAHRAADLLGCCARRAARWPRGSRCSGGR